MEGENKAKTVKRLATLVGCNYAGTHSELRGCINDVRAARDTLVSRFGFAPGDIAVLTDEDRSESGHHRTLLLPTGANIKRALADMVARASPGDVLFFHYSGHGTLVPPRPGHGHGHEESEKDEEAIVPCDFNLITGADLRRVVDMLPQGSRLTVVSDSCHSGGLIDMEKEQIGPDVFVPDAGESLQRARTGRATRRFLPYSVLLEHLAGVSGMAASEHHAADHLLALFGVDASAKFHSHGAAQAQAARRDDGGILLSGCQSDETSADVPAWDEGGEAEACGAFSSAVQRVLAAHGAPVSNRELVADRKSVV